jgi:hypothetical protein
MSTPPVMCLLKKGWFQNGYFFSMIFLWTSPPFIRQRTGLYRTARLGEFFRGWLLKSYQDHNQKIKPPLIVRISGGLFNAIIKPYGHAATMLPGPMPNALAMSHQSRLDGGKGI